MTTPPHYRPMPTGTADELIDGLLDVVDQQPPEIRDRLYQAIKSGTYSLVAATPDQLVIDIHGVGELVVARVPMGRA